jgi:hypothetical protein
LRRGTGRADKGGSGRKQNGFRRKFLVPDDIANG